jgi:nucleotide-binding universal stress UspA family protein
MMSGVGKTPRRWMKMIVVGVDGSEGGAAALEFAAEEAAFRGARLRIVSAWEVPVAAYGGGFAPPLDPATWDALRLRSQQVADDAFAAVKKLQPSLEAEALAVKGQPADVLREQGADAALIVVGRRGLGGFKSLLLGSVSQQVVHHATCPVVVVNQPAADS